MNNNESTSAPCANHKTVLAMKAAYVKQWGSEQLPVDLETAQKNKPKVGRPSKESINQIHDIAKELLVKGEDESFPVKALKPVPDSIVALRGDGSLEALVAYGEALRLFRQQS